MNFRDTFHTPPEAIGVDPADTASAADFTRRIQELFLLGRDKLLPPLNIDDNLIDRIHEVLLASEDRDVILTMLTALSCWGNGRTPEVLEQSLAAVDPDSPVADALLRYHILAAAHHQGLAENMEMALLDHLASPECSKETQKVIFYLIRQKRNEFLLLQLTEIKRTIVKDFSWHCESHGLQLIDTCFFLMEEGDLAELFEPRDLRYDGCYGVFLRAAGMQPERASLILDFCGPHTGSEFTRDLACEEIRRIAEGHRFLCSLEGMSPEERERFFDRCGDPEKRKKLWDLLYPEDGGYPALTEGELLSRIEVLNPRWFTEALIALGALAAPVMLEVNDNEGLLMLQEQRKALAGDGEASLYDMYEPGPWGTPVENASFELMDQVTLYLQDGTCPDRLFTLLRIMLTVRQHTLRMEDDEVIFPGINSPDMFYCRAEDIFPLIVDTLRRELFYPLTHKE